MNRWIAGMGALIVLWAGVAWALTPPELTGRVVDLAGVLESEQKTRIIQLLEGHEAATTQQFAVLILPGLEGDALEDFSIRTVEKWQLGTREEDNGLLILVAMAERKMRIEVGYGLEGRIPDVTANRVIEEVLKPEFRAGRFGEGIETAVQQLIQMARGETPAPNSGRNTISWFEKLLVEGFLLLFQGMMIFGWFFAAAQVWVLLTWIGCLITGRPLPKGSSSGSGGYSGGGSYGGGSFSGGGGSFGGGGASGSW